MTKCLVGAPCHVSTNTIKPLFSLWFTSIVLPPLLCRLFKNHKSCFLFLVVSVTTDQAARVSLSPSITSGGETDKSTGYIKTPFLPTVLKWEPFVQYTCVVVWLGKDSVPLLTDSCSDEFKVKTRRSHLASSVFYSLSSENKIRILNFFSILTVISEFWASSWVSAWCTSALKSEFWV